YVALAAAGAMGGDELIRLSHRRGKVIKEAAASSPGGMAAVDAPPEKIEPVLNGVAEVWVAHHNSPGQTVIAGTAAGLAAAAGTQAVLTGLASQTLAGKPHLAVASDLKTRPGLVQLAHLLGLLIAAGVPARLDRLFRGRGLKPFDVSRLGPDTGKPKPPPT